MTTPEQDQQIAHAQAVADKIRADWPDKAAEIEAAIQQLRDGRREGLTVTATFHARLEKFDGEMKPGDTPVEVIETNETL